MRTGASCADSTISCEPHTLLDDQHRSSTVGASCLQCCGPCQAQPSTSLKLHQRGTGGRKLWDQERCPPKTSLQDTRGILPACPRSTPHKETKRLRLRAAPFAFCLIHGTLSIPCWQASSLLAASSLFQSLVVSCRAALAQTSLPARSSLTRDSLPHRAPTHASLVPPQCSTLLPVGLGGLLDDTDLGIGRTWSLPSEPRGVPDLHL